MRKVLLNLILFGPIAVLAIIFFVQAYDDMRMRAACASACYDSPPVLLHDRRYLACIERGRHEAEAVCKLDGERAEIRQVRVER